MSRTDGASMFTPRPSGKRNHHHNLKADPHWRRRWLATADAKGLCVAVTVLYPTTSEKTTNGMRFSHNLIDDNQTRLRLSGVPNELGHFPEFTVAWGQIGVAKSGQLLSLSGQDTKVGWGQRSPVH
ncbi:hypothetical protein PoB_001779000 [Plakobranchus ocellatus]|uniref:Uncharacterized protein n=1 Tax=Plakobranchus ocellatus TaxID=259542 RepID=A0AAV3Z9S7_9GAST|nr:hypothetical protein PoB_001779000 [Plakobranchus ocellatus]